MDISHRRHLFSHSQPADACVRLPRYRVSRTVQAEVMPANIGAPAPDGGASGDHAMSTTSRITAARPRPEACVGRSRHCFQGSCCPDMTKPQFVRWRHIVCCQEPTSIASSQLPSSSFINRSMRLHQLPRTNAHDRWARCMHDFARCC